MRDRRLGRTGWNVSEIGYGMWGMGGWTGADDEEALRALDHAVARACSVLGAAWVAGHGPSARLPGRTVRQRPGTRLTVATKIPPKNMQWPAKPGTSIAETYPPDHIREYTEKSLFNLGLAAIDLQQFHVWSDHWAGDEQWQRAVRQLKDEDLVRRFGIS